MADDAGRYSLVDVDRMLAQEPIADAPLPKPPPAPRHSVTVERIKAVGPTLAGVGGVIVSIATLITAFSGALSPDLAPIQLRLQAIEGKLDAVAEKQRETSHELSQHQRDHETRDANARAIRDLIGSGKTRGYCGWRAPE